MPPLYRRLTTPGLWVERPWVGLLRWVPHGATHSRGRGAGVFMRRAFAGCRSHESKSMAHKMGGVNELGKLRKQF
jgi:hypothetical protein